MYYDINIFIVHIYSNNYVCIICQTYVLLYYTQVSEHRNRKPAQNGELLMFWAVLLHVANGFSTQQVYREYT